MRRMTLEEAVRESERLIALITAQREAFGPLVTGENPTVKMQTVIIGGEQFLVITKRVGG